VTSISSASVEVRDGSLVPAESIRGLSAQIRASVLSTSAPFTVNFTSVVAGGVGPYTYRWDYSDGSFSTEPNPTHIFETPGVRPVQLTVRDSRGSTTVASLTIVLDESSDLDND
jgi:PKD repeat protein